MAVGFSRRRSAYRAEFGARTATGHSMVDDGRRVVELGHRDLLRRRLPEEVAHGEPEDHLGTLRHGRRGDRHCVGAVAVVGRVRLVQRGGDLRKFSTKFIKF